MVRIAFAYLAIAVIAILLVNGLPFGSVPSETTEVAAVDEAALDAALQVEPEPSVVAQIEPVEALPIEPVVEVATENESAESFLGIVEWFEQPGESGKVAGSDDAVLSAVPSTIEATTALILKELSVQPALPSGMAAGVPLAEGSEGEPEPGVLEVVETAGAFEPSLETFVTAAIAGGQSAELIDRALNEAASQGLVRIPAMMITTDGRVDSDVLVASILARTKEALPEEGDISVGDSFVTPETAILDIEDLPYLVQPGDSLGGIALRFYGSAMLFQPIFDANREGLASPSSIRAGQRLVIPSRSKL